MGDEFPFLDADGLNPLCFLLLKRKKRHPKAAAFHTVGCQLITRKAADKS